MAFGRVSVRFDQRVGPQRLLHARPLDTDAASVNEANLPQARGVRGVNVFLDYRGDLGGRKRVEIERAVDRNAMRVGLVVGHSSLRTWSVCPYWRARSSAVRLSGEVTSRLAPAASRTSMTAVSP